MGHKEIWNMHLSPETGALGSLTTCQEMGHKEIGNIWRPETWVQWRMARPKKKENWAEASKSSGMHSKIALPSPYSQMVSDDKIPKTVLMLRRRVLSMHSGRPRPEISQWAVKKRWKAEEIGIKLVQIGMDKNRQINRCNSGIGAMGSRTSSRKWARKIWENLV